MNITIAKEVKNQQIGSTATIVHFYGADAMKYGVDFNKTIRTFGDHPFNLLIDLGFEPIGDLTWIKK